MYNMNQHESATKQREGGREGGSESERVRESERVERGGEGERGRG